jgi:hypothetical protein
MNFRRRAVTPDSFSPVNVAVLHFLFIVEPEEEFSDDLSFGCAVISEDMLSADLKEFVPEFCAKVVNSEIAFI